MLIFLCSFLPFLMFMVTFLPKLTFHLGPSFASTVLTPRTSPGSSLLWIPPPSRAVPLLAARRARAKHWSECPHCQWLWGTQLDGRVPFCPVLVLCVSPTVGLMDTDGNYEAG